jgi:hypothetical protein
MICFFFFFFIYFFFIFVSVDTIWGSKNASIALYSNFSERKLNLVGILGGQKLKIFNIFLTRREKPLKNEGKTVYFTQNQFSTKSNFLFCYNSKTNRCKYLKFSPNV